MEAADHNAERAKRGAVVIDNLDRIAKPSDEFSRIQEELELAIRGLNMPVEVADTRRARQPIMLDTSTVSFFAGTSVLHAGSQPVAASAAGSGPPSGNTSRRIEDALIARGFLPDLVAAFDHVWEYDPIAADELAQFLERSSSSIVRDWLASVEESGAELETGWAGEIVAAVQRKGTGLRGPEGDLGPAVCAHRLRAERARGRLPRRSAARWIRDNTYP